MHFERDARRQPDHEGHASANQANGCRDRWACRPLQMLPLPDVFERRSNVRTIPRANPPVCSTNRDQFMRTARKRRPTAQQRPDSLTIVLISDTHELHREVNVPPGDLLIHAGDFTMNSMSAERLIDFNDWLGELPHAFRVVIPGNHDFVVEEPSRRQLITNATLLINESIEIMGLKVWGSPATPLLGEAFGVVSDTDRAKLYSRIPADTDVLVTHGPPYGILDQAPGSEHHQGCRQLLAAVRR